MEIVGSQSLLLFNIYQILLWFTLGDHKKSFLSAGYHSQDLNKFKPALKQIFQSYLCSPAVNPNKI